MRFARGAISIALGVLLALGLAVSASADDWMATKLRGAVFVLVDSEWVQLSRGDVVPDDRVIRTAGNGRVQFRRDAETIDLGPDTQIRIFDRNGQKFTVVQQHFGDVAIEADRRNVQHFAVQTEFLAAVVKGTRFSVETGPGGSEVAVQRGVVQVRDSVHHTMVDITPGQSASVSNTQALAVSGEGAHAPVVSFTDDPLLPEDASETDFASVDGTAPPPGTAESTPGLADLTPSDGAEPPGLALTTPGLTGTNPGKSGSAPGIVKK